MFLLEGFNGMEASGGVDLAVAGVFCGVDQALSSGKDKVKKKKKTKKTCMFSENFSRFLVKSVYVAIRVTVDCSHIKTANQLVLGRLLCWNWLPVKKSQDCQSTKS